GSVGQAVIAARATGPAPSTSTAALWRGPCCRPRGWKWNSNWRRALPNSPAPPHGAIRSRPGRKPEPQQGPGETRNPAMNAMWRWVDPRVAKVRLADLRAYLLARGWK